MNDGGQAFPSHIEHDDPTSSCSNWCHLKGMSLRDYFAAKAISEMTWSDLQKSAENCYKIADAMLREREKERES